MYVCLDSLRRLRTGWMAALAGTLIGCGNHTAPPPQAPPQVGVETVTVHSVQAWDQFNGRVSAIQSVVLRPRVSGYIQQVAYPQGSEVKQGQLLFVIDPRPYRDALASAEAQLARAHAAADLANRQARRAQTLISANAISHEEFDSRHADVSQTQADVQAAVAAVATARLNLDFTEVRAPVAGRSGRAELTVGNLAQADQTELTTLASQDPVYVYFDCDEHSYLQYQALARQGGRNNDANPVRVALANETGFVHHGSLDFMDNQLDRSTGTIQARAVLPNPDRAFTPGLFARVQLPAGDPLKAIVIDDKAILTDQDRQYVYIVGPGSVATRKDIVPGRLIDGRRVVTSGLQAGDRVVVSGLESILFPGMPVQAQPVDHAAATAALAAAAH